MGMEFSSVLVRCVADYAFSAFRVRRGCKGFDDFIKLNRERDEVDGAALVTDVDNSGCNQLLTYSIQGIDNRFTLDNEDVLRRSAQLLCDVVLKPLTKENGFPEIDLELEYQNLIDKILRQN